MTIDGYTAIEDLAQLWELGKGKQFALCLSSWDTTYRVGIDTDEAGSLFAQASANGTTLMATTDDRYVWLKVSGHLEWE